MTPFRSSIEILNKKSNSCQEYKGSMTKSGVKRGCGQWEEAKQDLSDIDLDIAEAEADSFDHLDFGMNAFGIGIGGATIEVVQDVAVPSLEHSSPVHHGSII